ncbi:hypothetical protein EV715DRAFT_297212 [Schizophyllum commune]
MLENPEQLQEHWSPPRRARYIHHPATIHAGELGPTRSLGPSPLPVPDSSSPPSAAPMTATHTTSTYPASRFNPFKTSSDKPSAPPTPDNAYIPYNGPVEPPATLRAPALPDSQARGDLKIDVSRANTHSAAGEWGVLDADMEWQPRYGAEVINIASEALAQTRANQAALAAPYADIIIRRCPLHPLKAPTTFLQARSILSPHPRPSSSPRIRKPVKSPKSPRSITNLRVITIASSSSRKGAASVLMSPRHLRPQASSSTMREQSYFSNPILEPILDNLWRPSPDGSESPIIDSTRKQSSDGTRASTPDVLCSPPRKLQHSGSAEWSVAPRSRIDNYAPRARVDSYQPAAYQSAMTSRLRPSIPAPYATVEARSFSLLPSPRKPSFDARDFLLATDVARNHSFDTREPARSFDTRNPAPSSNAYEPSQYGWNPASTRTSLPRSASASRARARRCLGRTCMCASYGRGRRRSWRARRVREWQALAPKETQPMHNRAQAQHQERALDFRHAQRAAAIPDRRLAKRTTCSNVPPFDRAGLVFTPDICICMPMGRRQGPRMIWGVIRPSLASTSRVTVSRHPSLFPTFASPTPPPLSISPKPKWELPQGRDKGLSAEMWCNTLLLPRRRLQLRSLTGKMGASLTGSKPGSGMGSTSKVSVSKGSLAAGSIGKSTPKSSFAAGTEGDQYASYAAPLHSNAPPSSYAYASASLVGGYQQQQRPSSLHPPNHSHPPQQHSHPTNRIVSPPGRSLARDDVALPRSSNPSRMLVHSRSLVDLVRPDREAIEIARRVDDEDADEVAGVLHGRQPSGGRLVEEHRRQASGGNRREVDRAEAVAQPGAGPSTLRADPRPLHLKPPRPRSFAADDLSLPSPVLPLAKGHSPREPASQAAGASNRTGSLLNKRARDLSRSHSKSLTKGGAADTKAKLKKPGPTAEFDFGLGSVKLEGPSKTYDSGASRKKKPHRVQESIDFLGRALLGNQAPVHIQLEEPGKESGSLRGQQSQPTSEGTYNRSSQGTGHSRPLARA